MFFENNFTEMAKRIIPKAFSMTAIPPGPKIFCNLPDNFKTKKIIGTLSKMAMMIFNNWNSALNEINVEMVPAPAMVGKANGTMLAT